MSEKIRVIFYRDADAWLAQGIEHDICVQADTLDELYGRFEVAVRLECVNDSLDHIGPAPAHFHKMWERKAGAFMPAHLVASKYEIGLAA